MAARMGRVTGAYAPSARASIGCVAAGGLHCRPAAIPTDRGTPMTTTTDAEKDLLQHLVLDFRQMREFAEVPWVFTRGEGIRLQDESGKWYVDGLSGVFVNSLGYGNERVLAAAFHQLSELHFAPPLHGTTRPAIELAERLRRLAPEAMQGEHG